jgi:type 1 glutamine amidotransferase
LIHDAYLAMDEPDWAREGKTWEAFVNGTWAAHRTAPGMPPTDGWKKQHDDSYLRTAIGKAHRPAK